MITTRDIKIKDAKPEKLTILTTGKHRPKGFAITGKAKPRDKRMITTSNVEQFQKKKSPSKEEKAFAMKARMEKVRAGKKEKAPRPNGPHSPKKITVMDKE